MTTNQVQLKIVILGDSGVGKTSLMNQYVLGKHEKTHRPTIGVDFLSRQITVDDCPVLVQIWDTAGQERFLSMGSTFLRGTEGAVIVFDVTDSKSFTNLQHWSEYIYSQLNLEKETCSFPLLVIGNKIDCAPEKRSIEQSLAAQWARDQGFLYYETSARDNLNIEKAFKSLVDSTLKYTCKGPNYANRHQSLTQGLTPTVKLADDATSKPDGGCCGK